MTQKVSIFTPTNNSSYLPEIYKSIKDQPFHEWIIVYNNGGVPIEFDDPRVIEHVAWNAPEYVGAMKAECCKLATGDVLLELDHDDLLMPTAIEDVQNAFEDPKIGFAYSNTIHAMGDFTPVQRFDERYGWKFREVEAFGHKLDEHISFEPTPESISRIWFAPNHLRAFRRSVYEKIGGYNVGMRILDDMELMCRMYLETKFQHIDKGLYVYRVHGGNTWLRFNQEIQDNVYRIYDDFIEVLVDRWTTMNGYRKIELGGRLTAAKGYETVDLKGADINTDLDNDWPLEDSSVGVIRAMDVFEHLKDPIHTMRECSRVLVPGGWIICQVPSTDGRGAFQDPTHKTFWNQNSFFYYTRKSHAKYIDTPVRFQAPRLYTTEKNADGVCWTVAHLINCKDGYRPCGLLEI
jgi:SAM-dependent methyltransferase